jgi:hypothetical protein
MAEFFKIAMEQGCCSGLADLIDESNSNSTNNTSTVKGAQRNASSSGPASLSAAAAAARSKTSSNRVVKVVLDNTLPNAPEWQRTVAEGVIDLVTNKEFQQSVVKLFRTQ